MASSIKVMTVGYGVASSISRRKGTTKGGLLGSALRSERTWGVTTAG